MLAARADRQLRFAAGWPATAQTFTNLYSFTALSPQSTNSDGAHPKAGLILSGNTLYGTAQKGGSSGYGTLFSITLGSGSVSVPRLIIKRFGTNVMVTWPTNLTGYTLQSTRNLASPTVWITNSPAPVVVNGQYAVTNAIAGTRKFYRLIQ